MQVAARVMIASVGSTICGSSRSSTRTSPGECITTPLISVPLPLVPSGWSASAITPLELRCLRILFVADVAAPAHRAAAVIGELHRDVRHQARWRGAVPVVLPWLEEDPVTRSDHLDRAAFALAEAEAFGDPDRLAERVSVPGGARAGREVDGGGTEVPVALGRGDRVDMDRAGEPLSRAVTRLEGVACDLHVGCSFVL